MSENEAISESWDRPTGFPSIATLNRRAAGKKDSDEKRRYIQNLLVKLDGEIGEQRQTFNELLETGELPDPVPAQLHVERLEMLRAHVVRRLEQVLGEASKQPGSGAAPTEVPGASLVQTEEPTAAEPSDPLLSVEEVAKLLGQPKSWVYKRSMLDEIPRYKIRRAPSIQAKRDRCVDRRSCGDVVVGTRGDKIYHSCLEMW